MIEESNHIRLHHQQLHFFLSLNEATLAIIRVTVNGRMKSCSGLFNNRMSFMLPGFVYIDDARVYLLCDSNIRDSHAKHR